jgi:hypothetical protein
MTLEKMKVDHSHQNSVCCSHDHASSEPVHNDPHTSLNGHHHVDVQDTSSSRLLLTIRAAMRRKRLEKGKKHLPCVVS